MRKDELADLAFEAIGSLSGEALTRRHLEANAPKPGPGGRIVVLALGKAAPAMARGAVQALGPLEGLVIGAEEEPASGLEVIAGDHPVPGPRSLEAGRRLLERARSLRPDDLALVLLSGGGSALAESLAPGVSAEEIAAATRTLLGSGLPIADINAGRRRLSAIKGGGLLTALGTRRIAALAISDVEGDDPAVIASGPLAGGPPLAILAGPDDLARAAREAALRRGIECEVLPFRGGDAGAVASEWARRARERGAPLLAAPAEPTLRLPAGAPPGGRSQHVALLVARALRGTEHAFAAVGSDGRDGATEACGAAVDGTTDDGTLQAALDAFESTAACARLGVALPRRRTGTNLSDLHLLWR